MKKTLCSLLIIAILMNFIVCSVSYADGQEEGSMPKTPFLHDDESDADTEARPSEGASAGIVEEGKVSQKNGQEANVSTDDSMAGSSILGAVLGFLAFMTDIIPLQLHIIVSMITMTETTTSSGGASVPDEDFWVTIERVVFNKIALFNIDFFSNSNEYTVGTSSNSVTITANATNLTIRKSVAKMYVVCRVLSLIISLLVLIYIGIRMALSSVATEEAKYKKMLTSWVESIAILFILQYIMTFAMYFSSVITNVFYDIKCQLQASGGESFETTIVTQIIDNVLNGSGYKLAMYSIMYWILVFVQFKFFYLYAKRMLTVAFLIMIAPLITITYPIDKAGDNIAQAFSAWLKEFLMNVFIQPIHAIVFIVFMFTAGEIAKYAPILGLIFMMSLGRVEKTIKLMFNANKVVSLGGLDKEKKGK